MAMSKLLTRYLKKLKEKPLARGMVIYTVTWPASSFIQQSLFSDEKYDYKRMLKFGLFGALIVAPGLHTWMTISCRIWPQKTLKYGVIKAVVEQIVYSPFFLSTFFFVITLLDGGTVDQGVSEVSHKLVPTWKVGLCFWPFVQTLNYSYIPEKNRVALASICGMLWSVFLMYMKYKGINRPVVQES